MSTDHMQGQLYLTFQTSLFLRNETNNMMSETNALLEVKRVLEKALQETEKQLHNPQEGLHNSEKRKGKQLVHDIPEQEQIWVGKLHNQGASRSKYIVRLIKLLRGPIIAPTHLSIGCLLALIKRS